MVGLSKCTVRVFTRNKPDPMQEVKGYCVPGRPELVLHRSPDGGYRWNVTHAKSGLSVMHDFKSAAVGELAMRALLQYDVPWAESADEVAKHPDASRLCRLVQQDYASR